MPGTAFLQRGWSAVLHYYPNVLILYTLVKTFGIKPSVRRRAYLVLPFTFLALVFLDIVKLDLSLTGEDTMLSQFMLISLYLLVSQVFAWLFLRGWFWYQLAVIVMWWYFYETVRVLLANLVFSHGVPIFLLCNDIALTFCSLLIIRLDLNFDYHISRKIIVLLAALSLYTEVFVYGRTVRDSPQLLVVLPYALAIMIFVYWCFSTLLHQMARIYETEFASRLHEAELRQARESYQEMRALRHDYRNHLALLSTLLEKQEYGELKEYLAKYQEHLGGLLGEIHSGNSTVDAILQQELFSASQQGIPMHVTAVVPQNLQLDLVDLAGVLFNALDNAIQYSAQIPDPEISVEITTRNCFLVLSVKNKVKSRILEENPDLVTTKKDHLAHGNGVSIIRGIVKKYHGNCDFSQEGDYFELGILMQMVP